MDSEKRELSRTICGQNSQLIQNSHCSRCPLGAAVNSVCIIGHGPWKEPGRAKIVLIGEAPGRREDETGYPFVGRSGAWLRDQIEWLEMSELVYITNAVKCRPPQNRTPKEEEIFACSKYLRQELAALAPRVVITLGRTAANAMGWEHRALQGPPFFSNHRWGDFYARLTYHPSYVLRTRSDMIAANIREALLWAKKFGLTKER